MLSLEVAGHFTGMGFDPALLYAAETDAVITMPLAGPAGPALRGRVTLRGGVGGQDGRSGRYLGLAVPALAR